MMSRTNRNERTSDYRLFADKARVVTREKVHHVNKGIRTRSRSEAKKLHDVTDTRKEGFNAAEWML